MTHPLYFRIAGVLLLGLAASHLWFPRLFAWKSETARLSPFNRQVFYVHSFFIALAVFLNGLLFAGWPHLLLRPDPLARLLLLGIGAFWLCRLGVQLFVYDRTLWRGSATRTAIHIGFTCFWAYLTAICFLVVSGDMVSGQNG